jgi:transposase
LRERLAGLGRVRLLRRCCSLRPDQVRDPQLRASLLALRLCARRVEQRPRKPPHWSGKSARSSNDWHLGCSNSAASGPISASAILVSWSHPGRLKSEAAFARLAGVAPIPASSGQVVRHRPDRGGDRRLNRALHTIALQRSRTDADTIAYITRRRSEGKSLRDALRCLKRYLVRSLFRMLEATPTTA